MESDDGREGWGETPWPPRPDERLPRRHSLLAALQGRSIFDVEELLELDALPSAAVRSAVEMAAWDLIGRTLKQPLCRLWGGEYRPMAPIAVRLPPAAGPRVAEVAWALAEQGYLTQVVAASGNADEDLRTLAAVRARVGTGVRLRFDGRAAFDSATAPRPLRRTGTRPAAVLPRSVEYARLLPRGGAGGGRRVCRWASAARWPRPPRPSWPSAPAPGRLWSSSSAAWAGTGGRPQGRRSRCGRRRDAGARRRRFGRHRHGRDAATGRRRAGVQRCQRMRLSPDARRRAGPTVERRGGLNGRPAQSGVRCGRGSRESRNLSSRVAADALLY